MQHPIRLGFVLCFALLLGNAALADKGGGHEVGGNGDRVSGWFTALGFELLTEIKRAEVSGHPAMPEVTAAEFEKALGTQVVLVDATNLALLTNQFGEVKDIKVVWQKDKENFLILLDRKLWTALYEKKEPDYRTVLHAYVLAAGKRERNYLVTRQVNFPRLMAPRPTTFERDITLTEVHPAPDGGFIGLAKAMDMHVERVGNEFRPYYYPHDSAVKLNSSGMEEWRQTIVGVVKFILPTDDGGYLVMGLKRKDPGDVTESPQGRPKAEVPAGERDRNKFNMVVKLTRAGEMEWKRAYCSFETSDGACADENLGAFELPNGNYAILSGNSLHEMDTSGAVDGSKIRLMNDRTLLHVEALREGGAVMVGIGDGKVPFALQQKPDGGLLWHRELAFEGRPNVVVPTRDRGFLVGGEAKGEPLLMKLNAAGKEVWRKTFPHPTKTSALRGMVRSIVPLPNGAFFIAVGHSADKVENWTLKQLSSAGDVLWEKVMGSDPIGTMAYPGDGGLVFPQGSRLFKIKISSKGPIDF